jgi:hypothetical protein
MKKLVAALFICAAWILSINSYADRITLKDEQVFDADIINFDNYFLNVRLIRPGMTETAKPAEEKIKKFKSAKIVKTEKSKDEISIPWTEVLNIKHTTTASNWLEETHITSSDVDVNTFVVPFSEDTAFSKSVFPGILIHGAGSFYAKDNNMGMSLLSSEIVGVIISAISAEQMVQAYNPNQNYSTTYIMGAAGAAMFTISWLWDMIFCRGAVDKYNSEHKFLINEGNNENSAGK